MPRKKNIPAGSDYWKKKWEYQKRTGEDKEDLVRQKARAAYDKAGISRKGKHIEHKKKVSSGGTSARSNLTLRDPSENMADNKHHKGEKKSKS
jgi:hypothetical protein